MFEPNPLISEGVEKLWEAYGSSVKRGQVIYYSEIEAITGYPVSSRIGWAMLCRVRKKLASVLGIITECTPGHSLRLLTHQQAASHATKMRARKARRCINRGIRESTTVDPTELGLLERKSFHAGVSSMKYNRLALSRCSREMETILKASDALPKRVPGCK